MGKGPMILIGNKVQEVWWETRKIKKRNSLKL